MAQKDVDEQFAAIMAHWDDVALGRDPSGDTLADSAADAGDGVDEDGHDAGMRPDSALPGDTEAPAPPIAPFTSKPVNRPEIRPVRDLSDLRDVPDVGDEAEEAAESAHLGDPAPGGTGWRAQTSPPEDDEHYTPPPPAPLPPSEDKHFWIMVVALVTGPLMFLYLLLFNRDGNGWWMMFALLISIAGFVLLVLRQPMERDEDDDGIRL